MDRLALADVSGKHVLGGAGAFYNEQQAEAQLAAHMGRYGALGSRAIQLGIHPGRQAGDGEHYLEDPARPGKFLRIDSRSI